MCSTIYQTVKVRGQGPEQEWSMGLAARSAGEATNDSPI